MHQVRENLDILFRRTQPEVVLENIRQFGRFSRQCPLKVDAAKYSEQTFNHYSKLNYSEYSYDEVSMRYKELQWDDNDKGMIFSKLYSYAEGVIVKHKGRISCKIEEVLNWNSITSRLGQDIFTTVWLAHRDVWKYDDIFVPYGFSWPAILTTDDVRLNEILHKGLAENHFHLNGSTQSFPLSWASLMNHPEYIKHFVREGNRFVENLNHSISKGILDNVMELDKRILYAAMIRGLLFERCVGLKNGEEVFSEFKAFDKMPLAEDVKDITESLRFYFGVKWEQMNGRKKCLDYANCDRMYLVDDKNNNRLLAGERNFLYHCFVKQFQGEFSMEESSLFYLYLLIKSNFRSELIQTNGQTGFYNFQEYQNRKNQFFEFFDEYITEAMRLSVVTGIKDSHIEPLEARVMPRKTAKQLKKSLKHIDKRISSVLENKEEKLPYFYTIHFAKSGITLGEVENKQMMLLPRNYKVRKRAKAGAKALVQYLSRGSDNNPRVFGIDACSHEIGCRPETFATEFRYIRGSLQEQGELYGLERRNMGGYGIGLTYHVGEDFLDIVDALRAIDEVMRFLGMRKGDRLGHALALGIEPESYYLWKRGSIYLPKQDYLDNLVWILFRSLELNVVIEENHRAQMREIAKELIWEIYPHAKFDYDILDTYYDSWKLRGDHPDLYRTGKYLEASGTLWEPYRRYMASEAALVRYRKSKGTAFMYYRYHFDSVCKKKGLEVIKIDLGNWYIKLVEDLQKALRLEVCKRGIGIECNPTSNVLIGTFRKYDAHPILKFNNSCLDRNSTDTPNLMVSINTDDLGVFDTSLENEYALMFAAIRRMRHAQENYDDDAIYEYLDHVRENGIRMAFGKM